LDQWIKQGATKFFKKCDKAQNTQKVLIVEMQMKEYNVKSIV
jgi:hypothetical protein